MGYDIESLDGAYLKNTTVHNVSWTGLDVEVYDKSIGSNKKIVSNVNGHVNAGMVSVKHPQASCLHYRGKVVISA
jgi:hypothetical protein